MRVHAASLFLPLAGHVQVLHPSAAVNDKCGQHRSSGCLGSCGAGSCFSGGVKHFKLVHAEAIRSPLGGHMHVFNPSPAG